MYNINNNGDIVVINADKILIPTFELATNPTIKISEIKSRRLSIIDRSHKLKLTPTVEDLCGRKWDKGEIIEVFGKDK